MRYMIIVKATKQSEAGVLPPEHLLAEMAAYHGELSKAGVLVDGSGVQSRGDTDTLDRFRQIGLNGEEKQP